MVVELALVDQTTKPAEVLVKLPVVVCLSLLHDVARLREEDPVTVSRLVDHARASMSLDVYGHVLVDEAEINYEEVLA